jgi:hypothetical protein
MTGRWSVRVCEEFGRNQDDENVVVGRGDSLDDAVHDAERLAAEAGIDRAFLARVLSQAADDAETEADNADKAEAEPPKRA